MTNLWLLLLLSASPSDWAEPLSDSQIEKSRTLVEGMKERKRGPFDGVAWYCNDGTILPPKSYACQPHGGGLQYGYPSVHAKYLAEQGLYVGTILSSLKPEDFLTPDFYRLRAYVVESYLERSLDGWTLRLAKNYRGIRQIEDEQNAARELLIQLAKERGLHSKRRSLLLRVIRAMPYGRTQALGDKIRALAGQLGDAASAFASLRYKIHSLPEPQDMEGVRAYLSTAKGSAQDMGQELLSSMQEYYAPEAQFKRLHEVKKWIWYKEAKKGIEEFTAAPKEDVLGSLRAGLALIQSASRLLRSTTSDVVGERNLLLLHSMALAEEILVRSAAPLKKVQLTRETGLRLGESLVRALGALGYLTGREVKAVVARLSASDALRDLSGYEAGVEALSQTLDWVRARVVADLNLALLRYAAIEPKAAGVVDDILRSGLTLSLGILVDRLKEDIQILRGGGHELKGLAQTGKGSLRAENAGAAMGPLAILEVGGEPHALKRNQIALLRELPPELPPVAGLLTIGSAGSLSHVSLLARNLGIPHASIGADVAQNISSSLGKDILLAVSRGGLVSLGPASAYPVPTLDLFRRPKMGPKPFLTIAADKLDLSHTGVLRLKELSEKDSGVRVGPKAAELGRLYKLFPDRVSDAVVLPFGAFVAHVDRSPKEGADSPLARLRKAYTKVSTMEAQSAESFLLDELGVFRATIESLPFVPGFVESVKKGLAQMGRTGSFGVFVRSDTNVEDLKKFTGAGLNKTVANRVHLKAILKAIRKVWASPYSERSFRWRQRILTNPEYVFPSVLLHKTVPSEMSGVMVTTDLWGQTSHALTVSISEGVAAVVDGGAPETVVISPDGGTRLISSPRSATRKLIPRPPAQGVVRDRNLERDPLLGPKEIQELLKVVKEVRERIPSRDGLPWDIEFGFLRGKAYLLQIRPLRTATEVATHPLLRELDRNRGEQAKALSPRGELP